tara:strand:+ start:141 stop:575 length:435 start_codon:yes stop_codon:yes gene_type:complete
MIRLATKEDLPLLLKMGELFFDASGYSDITSFNKLDTKELLITLINLGTIVTDGKSGMLGFVIFPLFMNKKTIMSQELFWWVDEKARGTSTGIKLLKMAEKISKDSGANVMNMLSLEDLEGKKVNKMYSRLGYKRKEQSYMRIL